MSESFFNNIYGRCPLGHNSKPSGVTADYLSTHQISDNEEIPLYWSNYHQKYICKMCLNKVADIIVDEKRAEARNQEEEIRAKLGYTN